jgi:hypothetical protein
MIPSLSISLNNNLSFAFQEGKNDIEADGGGTWVEPMGVGLPSFGYVAGALENPDLVPGLVTAMSANQGLKVIGSGSDGSMLINMYRNDQKDSWFALWNSLGVTYKISERVSVSAALSNRLGVYEYIGHKAPTDNDENSAKYVTDDFQAAVAGFYNFSSNVSFAAGLHLGVWGTQADIKVGGSNQTMTGKLGEVMFAIPIQFKVSW